MSTITGGPGQQAAAVISYPIPLQEGTVLKLNYVPQSLSANPGAVPGCPGTVAEPTAESGNLCVYRGGNEGSDESQDLNAAGGTTASKTVFQSQKGVNNETGLDGEMLLFRNTKFNSASPNTATTEAVRFAAEGSWAVKQPEL